MYSLKDYIFSMKEVLSFTEEKVLILNPDGKVIYANDHFLTSSGYNRKDKSALNLNSLVSTGVKKSIDSASAVGIVSIEGELPEDYLNGGRALQRLWIAANQQICYCIVCMWGSYRLVYLITR